MPSRKSENNNKSFFTVALVAAFFMSGTLAWADQGHGKFVDEAINKRGEPAHQYAFGKPGKVGENTRTISVVMQDNFYEPETISVNAGETIRFKIVNKGEFLHEFGLGTSAMHSVHQKEMAKMMEHGMLEPTRVNFDRMKMDHGGGKMKMAHNDPNSILLEPGKPGDIVWKFTKAMKLEFACNIPGHYESGMMGDIKFN